MTYVNGYRRPSERRRETRSGPQRSAYHSIVGDSPEVKRGDTTTASLHLVRIRKAIDTGGWTRSEWRRLRLLEAKWAVRAAGKDLRYNMVGTQKCGLTEEQMRVIALYRSMQVDVVTPKSKPIKGKVTTTNGDRQKPKVQPQWTD